MVQLFFAASQARFNWRARLRIAVSRSVSTCLAIVVSVHCPSAERACRSTVTDSESECSARDKMKTLIRRRSFGLSGGEYHSVTIEPVSGSSEEYLTKSSVSCAACHRIGLTVLPVRGPGSFWDSFFASPSNVKRVDSVSISSGSLDFACCAPAASGAVAAGSPDFSAEGLPAQAASISEKIAAKAIGERY